MHLCPHPPLAVCPQGDYHDSGSVIMLLLIRIIISMMMLCEDDNHETLGMGEIDGTGENISI